VQSASSTALERRTIDPWIASFSMRNLANADQRERLDGLLESAEIVPARVLDPDLRGDVQLRNKDWPILSGAVAAGATHLITGDVRDFGSYFGKEVLGILILPPSKYLQGRS